VTATDSGPARGSSGLNRAQGHATLRALGGGGSRWRSRPRPKLMTQAPVLKNFPLKIPVEADRDPVTGLLPCLACTQCCHYVAIEIDTPESRSDFDQIRWYLYHPGIEIYIDHDDHWNVLFHSRCVQLQPDGKCGVYEHRPHICRDYSERTCEPNTNEPAEKVLLKNADDLAEWMRLTRTNDRLVMQAAANERRRKRRAVLRAAKEAGTAGNGRAKNGRAEGRNGSRSRNGHKTRASR
jgi:Fe-S-cluster containining protein